MRVYLCMHKTIFLIVVKPALAEIQGLRIVFNSLSKIHTHTLFQRAPACVSERDREFVCLLILAHARSKIQQQTANQVQHTFNRSALLCLRVPPTSPPPLTNQ